MLYCIVWNICHKELDVIWVLSVTSMQQWQKWTSETKGDICFNEHPHATVLNLGWSPKTLELQNIFLSEDFRKDTLQKVNCKYSAVEQRTAKTKVTEALPSPTEESKFLQKDGPIFFSCLYKEAGVVRLWFRTGVHSEASLGLAGSCSHPRKIQWEKKFMEASRSLFNSVWGFSESWVRVYKEAIKHRLGIISVGCLPVTGPQVQLRGSFSDWETIAEGEQTIQRSLSFCMVLSLALNKTGVPLFCLIVSTIFRSQWYFSTLFHYFSAGS